MTLKCKAIGELYKYVMQRVLILWSRAVWNASKDISILNTNRKQPMLESPLLHGRLAAISEWKIFQLVIHRCDIFAKITIKGLHASQTGPVVLHNLSFHIKSGQRIGVGMSSLHLFTNN